MVSKKRGRKPNYHKNGVPVGAWKSPERNTNPRCEETGKAIFLSESAARKSLVGQLGTKHVRIYRCDVHPSHFHLTKTYNNRLD